MRPKTDSVPFWFDPFSDKPNPPMGVRFRMDFGKLSYP
jgi:hypothetical protein